MTKYQKFPWLVFFVLSTGFEQNALAAQKILIIADSSIGTNSEISWDINQYIQNIVTYDNKKAQLILWGFSMGTNVQQCTPLWQRLQNEYFSAIANGDSLEGAVLIGDIPVPMINEGNYVPFDQIYMDIVNMSSGTPARYSVTDLRDIAQEHES